MMYKITGPGAEDPTTPLLTIRVPNDSNNIRYYVSIPNTNNPVSADVYPLNKGTDNIINTYGREVYLLVATLYQNVSTSATFSWSAPKMTDVTFINMTANG
jgi:hypothetical protein